MHSPLNVNDAQSFECQTWQIHFKQVQAIFIYVNTDKNYLFKSREEENESRKSSHALWFYGCNFIAQWAPTCLGQDGENKNTDILNMCLNQSTV
jgi:hypothetical protein